MAWPPPIFSSPDPTDPQSAPSHSGEHTNLATFRNDTVGKFVDVEQVIADNNTGMWRSRLRSGPARCPIHPP